MNFTSQPPTVPGAYWFKDTGDTEPILAHVFDNGVLYVQFEDCMQPIDMAEQITGLWSSRLVPVEEVEKLKVEIKEAYLEGHTEGYNIGNDDCARYNSGGGNTAHGTIKRKREEEWNSSHAKQIVDGTKGKESGE